MKSKTTSSAVTTLTIILASLLLSFVITGSTAAQEASGQAIKANAALLSSDNNRVTIAFDASSITTLQEQAAENEATASPTTSTGQVLVYGMPILPMVSRFVVVPSEAGIEFEYSSDSPQQLSMSEQPDICRDEVFAGEGSEMNGTDLFPPAIATVSDPIVIRGVRLVKVTTYPIQYNKLDGTFHRFNHITTNLKFNNNRPVNPALNSHRRNRSEEFLRFIDALAINGAETVRDNLDDVALNNGHYLVVTNEHCLQYVAPFIEWRRKAGYQVDILSLPDAIASSDPTEIMARIQNRYNDYLNQGIDPFDQLLLVGDREHYRESPAAGWVLAAKEGESTWPEGPSHADYKYACLEGDDNYPDVSVSRFCAGSEDILNLFTARTLSYEATPYMEDTRWFTRGAVFSSHWGNNPVTAWHVSIHTNLRWAEQLLKYKKFNDVRFYEDYEWHDYGERVANFERTQFDDGSNLLLARTETLYWADTVQNELSDNHIFPIRIAISGHGEFPTWRLLRVGSGEHLKGPVAATCGWGSPTTTGSSAIWLETTNALINRDLSFGWSRVLAITSAEQFFSNYESQAQDVYSAMKTDNDFYGDPGLKPWLGVPKLVRATIPASISPEATSLQITVTNEAGNVTVPNALVTAYAPGDMPAFDSEGYADYDGMKMWTATSGARGKVQFVFGDEAGFVSGTPIYITVTGRDIRPFFGEIEIQNQENYLDVAEVRMTESAGNGDGLVNPGESLNMTIRAGNFGQSVLNGVTATVSSISPYVIINGENKVNFGSIGSGAEADAGQTIALSISRFCPDATARPATTPKLLVVFSAENSTWNSVVELKPVAPHMTLQSINNGNIVQPGQERQLDFVAANIGSGTIAAFGVKLYALGSGITVQHDSVTFPSMDPGEHEWCNGTPLSATGSVDAIPGSICPMMLVFHANNDFIDTAYFDLQVGEPRANAPQGPDEYGYICYDNSDVNWRNAPEYDWLEISPAAQNADFEGTVIEVNRQTQFDVGDAKAIPLPFQIKFYGSNFDTVTVGTNGYVLPGNQSKVINPQNWPLDRGIGGGVGMMAPFWDWLKLDNNSNIYYYADAENGRFIIEWYRMKHYYPDQSELTFQVILYDRARWARESGDTDVLYQYKQIANISGNGDDDSTEFGDIYYASVGISSPTGTTGSSYTFRNTYPVTSTELAARSAINYTTSTFQHDGVVYGTVREAGTNNLVADAMVFTTYGLTCRTDHNGTYRLPNVVNGKFALTAWGETFSDSTLSGFNLTNADSIEVNFTLEHGSAAPDEPGNLPYNFAIASLYPNPFNGRTTIKFSLDRFTLTRMTAYDLKGCKVADIYSAATTPGNHTVEWDAAAQPTGVYLVKLETADGRVQLAKALLVR